jgi:hypothetical protein
MAKNDEKELFEQSRKTIRSIFRKSLKLDFKKRPIPRSGILDYARLVDIVDAKKQHEIMGEVVLNGWRHVIYTCECHQEEM